MSVYDLLNEIREEQRLNELAVPLGRLREAIPDCRPDDQPSGTAADPEVIEREIHRIHHLADEIVHLQSTLPELAAAADAERRRARGWAVLLGLLAAIVAAILLGQALL